MTRILVVFAVTLIYLPARAAVLSPSGSQSEPAPSAAALEASRAQQQANAPLVEDAKAAIATQQTHQGPRRTSRTPESPGALVAAIEASQAHARDAAAEAHRDRETSTARSRGLALMIAAAAGIAGLIFGRLGVNIMSRSTAREAAEASRPAAVRDDRSRSYGGEHRSYLIDTDEDA